LLQKSALFWKSVSEELIIENPPEVEQSFISFNGKKVKNSTDHPKRFPEN
jgi:hypothetical protein